MQVKETKDIRDVADVVSTLIVLDRGRFIVDAGREFQQLTDAIVETNKPGTLTITIEVSPSGWKEGTARPTQFDLKPKVKIKKPQHEAGKTIFFVTDDNRLTREDPDQEQMFAEQEKETNGRS